MTDRRKTWRKEQAAREGFVPLCSHPSDRIDRSVVAFCCTECHGVVGLVRVQTDAQPDQVTQKVREE